MPMNIEAYDIDSLRKLVRSLQNENIVLKAQLQKANIPYENISHFEEQIENEGKCVAYGPYWYMGNKYAMSPEDEKVAVELSEWAAHRVATSFIVADGSFCPEPIGVCCP